MTWKKTLEKKKDVGKDERERKNENNLPWLFASQLCFPSLFIWKAIFEIKSANTFC